MSFSENFTWGAATAAYQIEGTPSRAGGGESVWDMFCRRPEAVFERESGAVACDHYNRYAEDVALMRELGHQSYRFSIAWPQVLPEGVGRANEAGLDFYDRLVDALLAANITPWATLFHWDFRYDLYCRGGWLNRDSADWFAGYAALIADRLSDRVHHWMTLNEPQCFIGLGHQTGIHAPGDKLALRAHAKAPLQIGYAPVGGARIPATESAADIEAARRSTFEMDSPTIWNSAWWNDPPFLGHYPEDGMAQMGDAASPVPPGDEQAHADGADIWGYFQWSLMDNFEWAEGYKFRFGLVYVDYATQTRTPKDSAYWYRAVIRSHGASLHPAP